MRWTHTRNNLGDAKRDRRRMDVLDADGNGRAEEAQQRVGALRGTNGKSGASALQRQLQTSPRPSCRTQIFQQNCWIRSSTFYITTRTRSRVVASSLNRGSRAPESTFSPRSCSLPRRDCKHGKTPFPTPLPLLPVTPSLSLSDTSLELLLQTNKRVVGSRPFLAPST